MCHFFQSKPAYANSTNDVGKEWNKSKTESKTLSERSAVAENGVEGKEVELNGDKVTPNQPESAFNNDSKMCNTNPHLNALNTDSECHRDETLSAAVLKTEE